MKNENQVVDLRINVDKMPDGEFRGYLYHSDQVHYMFSTPLTPSKTDALKILGDLILRMAGDIGAANKDQDLFPPQHILDRVTAGRLMS